MEVNELQQSLNRVEKTEGCFQRHTCKYKWGCEQYRAKTFLCDYEERKQIDCVLYRMFEQRVREFLTKQGGIESYL